MASTRVPFAVSARDRIVSLFFVAWLLVGFEQRAMLLRHSDRINIAFADAASLGWPDPKGQPASSTNAPSAAATSSRQGRAAFNSPRLGDGRAGGAQVSRGFPAGFIQQRGLELPVKGHNLSHNPREDREARLKGLREGDRSAGKRPGGARFSALQLRTTASVPRVNVAPVQFKDIGEAARSRIAKMLGVAAPGAPIMHENPNLRVGDFVVMATYVVPKGPDSLFKALSYAFVGFTSASNAVADALLQEVEAEGAPGPELLQGMSSQQLLQTASDVFDLNVVVFGTPPRPPVHVYEPSLQSGIFYGPSVFLFEDADGDFSVVTEAAPRTAGSASTSGSQPATPSAPPPPSTSPGASPPPAGTTPTTVPFGSRQRGVTFVKMSDEQRNRVGDLLGLPLGPAPQMQELPGVSPLNVRVTEYHHVHRDRHSLLRALSLVLLGSTGTPGHIQRQIKAFILANAMYTGARGVVREMDYLQGAANLYGIVIYVYSCEWGNLQHRILPQHSGGPRRPGRYAPVYLTRDSQGYYGVVKAAVQA